MMLMASNFEGFFYYLFWNAWKQFSQYKLLSKIRREKKKDILMHLNYKETDET